MNSIHQFPVLHKLKQDFEHKIKLIYVLSKNNVIIVTEDDQVFAFGFNKNSLLGFGHNKTVSEPTQVMELCDKQIIDLTDGSRHMMALTKYGQCFSWGDNFFGQLGNGTRTENYTPLIINSLTEQNIIAMSCGYYHSLVLTKSGEVFAFGYNGNGELGVKNNANQSIPTLISEIIDQTVISISCGKYHSLALTQKGEVFSWGRNSYGQLGIGNYICQNSPIRVTLIGNIIKQISCGYSHSMLLSNDGFIYTFGSNDFGQLGNRDKLFENKPKKIIKSVLFTDIATHYRRDISMALSQNKDYYVWGEWGSESIITPRRTQFQSFNDILVINRYPKISYKIDVFNEKNPNSRIFKRLSLSFNDPENSDLRLKVEDKYIYVQKSIVKFLCKHFESMLSENWSESESNEIQIKGYSYNVFFAFIKYLYTDCIELKEVEELIDLLSLANSYLEEELKLKCSEMLEKSITIENFSIIYSASLIYNSHELEDFGFEFAINKMKDICETHSFKEMNSDHTKRLLETIIDYEESKYDIE